MSDTPANTPPPVGEAVMMPVLQSPNRATLFPDQSAIATAEDGSIELVFLRREVIAVGQQGRVVEVNQTGPLVKVDAFQFQTVTADIGHVRLKVEPALDLAMNILIHAVDNLNVAPDDILQGLQAAGIAPK